MVSSPESYKRILPHICRSQPPYPVVVASHPQESNQLAVGLTDGSVKVIEPPESEGKWGVSPPAENGILITRTASSSTTSNHTPDQIQRWDLSSPLYFYFLNSSDLYSTSVVFLDIYSCIKCPLVTGKIDRQKWFRHSCRLYLFVLADS